MRALADELLVVAAAALGREEDFFTWHQAHPTYTFNANHYPAMTVVGEPAEGQFRIGPHTPTSARSRCSTASPVRAACRSSRRTASGSTPRSCPAP